MGYTTEFSGGIAIEPPLNAEEIKFIQGHNRTRRMKRGKGPYYIHGTSNFGSDIKDLNEPPEPQLSLWCRWTCDDKGTEIAWDGTEKFYRSAEWMQWLIDHILGANPKAKAQLPFLQGHRLNGTIIAQGRKAEDRWKLVVSDNVVSVIDLEYEVT